MSLSKFLPPENKKKGNATKNNFWTSILNDVQNYGDQKLPSCKQMVILGSDESGKSTLVTKLQVAKTPKSGSGLIYTFLDVHDEYRDDHTRLGVWILEGDSDHINLLKFALNAETFPHTLVVLTASMTTPWNILSQLQFWISVLTDHLKILKLDVDVLQKRKQDIIRRWQEYTEPGEKPDSFSYMKRNSPPNKKIDYSLPLPETILTTNLGLDLIVVITETDYVGVLEKEFKYSSEHLDFIQQKIRRFCLEYGAALFYTSAKGDINCDLFSKYLIHKIYDLPFHTPASVIEKDSVFIPSGWDNINKISILYENLYMCEPDDYYRSVIIPPVVKKICKRDIEYLCEDEQSFLARQQKELLRNGASKSGAGLVQSSNTSGNGNVLANFFNSLLLKKTTSQETSRPKLNESRNTPIESEHSGNQSKNNTNDEDSNISND